jgi:hypothetical protein
MPLLLTYLYIIMVTMVGCWLVSWFVSGMLLLGLLATMDSRMEMMKHLSQTQTKLFIHLPNLDA